MAGHGHVDHIGDKRIALLIAVLALFLAVVETGAKSAQTEAITRNVEAANLWSFFQARTIRQTTVRTAAEEAELAKLGAQGETAELQNVLFYFQMTFQHALKRFLILRNPPCKMSKQGLLKLVGTRLMT